MVIIRASYPNDSLLTPDPPKVVEDLDVFEADQPLLLDISAIENATIGEVYGISSQTFSLPGTDINNRFFGNLFNLGATPNIAFQKSIDCQVLNDGEEVFSGKMYITDVITDQKGYTTYQVNVVNETVDLRYKLENLLLREVDFNQYDHAYNYANISASWSDNLFSGDVVYPLVNYGIPEDDTILPNIALGANDAESRTIDNKAFPLRLQQFKPAYRTKAIIDSVFDSLDYSYTSSFFDSDYFNNLYVLATDSEGIGVTTGNTNSGSFWAFAGAIQNFNALTPYKVNYTLTEYDNYFRYDLVNDEYEAYANGYYNFSLQFDYTVNNYNVNNRNRFVVRLIESGSGLPKSAKTYVDPPYTGTIYTPFPNVYLTVGQKVYVEFEYLTDDGTEVIYLAGGTGTANANKCNFKGIGPAAVVGGGEVDTALQFPVEYSALDFMLGLVEKFNLVIEPIAGEKNVLRIEPYQDWINIGDEKDWTDKVDRSVRYKIVHPITEQPKYITFRDEDDESAPNKYTLTNFGDTFGTYKYAQLDSDLAEGEREIGSFFAATPVKNIPGGNEVIIPTLGRRDETGQVRPYKFKPRLLYKNGLQTMPSAQGFDPDGDGCFLWEIDNEGASDLFYTYRDCNNVQQTGSLAPFGPPITVCVKEGYDVNRTGGTTAYVASMVAVCNSGSNGTYPGYYWVQDEFGTDHRESEWVQMTTFEYLPTDSSGSINDSRDLHFGNVMNPGWYQYFQPVQNGRTTRSAYNEYWATYVNSLYDIDARKLTCNVFLEPYEIKDIQLNDKYFIDGHYYRINKINGANLTYPESVEVELIKVFPIQLKYPRRRLTVDGTNPIDITVGDISADGQVSYIDFNSGDTVTDFGYISQAGAKDGISVFNINGSGSAEIKALSVSTGDASKTVLGANNVDPNSNNVMMAGSNNTVGQQTQNVLVLGENNSIEAGSNNTTALGRNHSATNTSTNVQFLGGTGNYVGNFTSDATIVGGVNLGISGSSVVTMVGGANNDIIDSPTSRNVMIGGLNTILSASQDTVVINSDAGTHTSFTGNTLVGDFQSSNAAVTGSDYRFNNTLVNGLYLEEDYYTNRHSYQVIAYSGSTDFAYSGNGLYKYIYEIDFDTVPSGSGLGEIELPTIASQDQIGRTILFKASNNINADNIVDIVSFGDTDEIEGARSYRLERPGQIVELRASQYPQGESLVTQWRVISAGIPFESSVTNEGAYGSFYSTGSQAIVASGSEQQVTFGNTFTSNLISLSGSGAIELEYAGAYSFTWTAKVQNFDNAIHYADFWVKYNGTDYPNSTVRAAIPARKDASTPTIQPVTVQILDVAANNGDKIELYWRGDSTELSLQYQTFGGTIPAAPSIRATIHAV